MALQVSGIDHVVLHVRDVERSKKFYVDFLGMTWAHGGPDAAFLRCGDQQVALFQVEPGQDLGAGLEVNHMALRLADGQYEQVKAALEHEGIEVTGREGDPHCLYFSDPDGHRLQLLTPRR